ncbi:MAG: glycosyltransferase, partial [Muribaculum sp.]|nr:glycosyltransferase [Muribaculum sp.]
YLFGKNLFGKKGIVLNNSVDVDKFYDVKQEAVEKLRNEFGISPSEIVIGSVARLNEVKNHERMLSIAHEMKRNGYSFKMIIVGRGELEDKLKAIVTKSELQDCVIFAGIRGDIPELMHLFDVFLMPSFFEGNPVTLIEAQAAGLRSVISDTITDKIDMGLGLVQRLSLEVPDSQWAKALLESKSPKLSKEEIITCLSLYGYDLKSNTLLLCNLYEGHKAE